MAADPASYEHLSDPSVEQNAPAFWDGREAGLISKTNAIVRLLAYAGITLVCLPIQIALRRVSGPRVWEPFCRWYHARALGAFKVKIEEIGVKSEAKPTLFVSNHNSYLDIEVLGAKINGTFIAMEQVATWPLFGLLSRLQDSVFIDRQTKSIAAQQRQITERFDRKQSLIMFPEGSSYTGTHMLPFRSSLFAVAKHEVEGEPITIQPVSVTFAKLDGLPLGRGMRSFYGWYGNSPIATHIMAAAGLGKLTVVLEWHEPKTIEDFKGNRKALSSYCESAIRAGMARARTT